MERKGIKTDSVSDLGDADKYCTALRFRQVVGKGNDVSVSGIINNNIRPLLNPPEPGEDKLDQLLRWLEAQGM